MDTTASYANCSPRHEIEWYSKRAKAQRYHYHGNVDVLSCNRDPVGCSNNEARRRRLLRISAGSNHACAQDTHGQTCLATRYQFRCNKILETQFYGTWHRFHINTTAMPQCLGRPSSLGAHFPDIQPSLISLSAILHSELGLHIGLHDPADISRSKVGFVKLVLATGCGHPILVSTFRVCSMHDTPMLNYTHGAEV